MSEEYDLKKSEKGIGQLYPILEAKDGDIIDGVHREKADKNWKRIRLEHIDTEEKKLVARLVANFHRRIVLYREKKEWINHLAEIYQKQGIKTSIAKKISETTGVGYETVLAYLNEEFKATDRTAAANLASSHRARMMSPKEALLGKISHHRITRPEAEVLVEEVIAEEKPKIEQQVKAKLLKSPEFQREVVREISKPQIVKASEPCPSGVCELPSRIEAGEPIDVRAESLAKFWKKNPECLCKKCEHYGKCGVFR